MELPILQDIAIIFGISMVVLFVCDKIRLPSIIGFIATGAFIGPNGLHLIQSHEQVEALAEIGVVLLMFMIGLELSIKELIRSKKAVLLGGSLQVSLTILGIFFVAQQTGFEFGEALFFGFLVSLSSTAIVLGLFQANDTIHTPHGKIVLSILIFQDIIVVVMMLVTPLLKGTDTDITASLLILLLKTIVIIGLMIVCTKYVVPHLMYHIANTKTQDLFLLSIVAICLLIAWGSSQAGLSLGLGAFLAGLVISESEYSLRALGSVFPFRSVFLSFFFVSVGSLLDPSFLVQNLFPVVLITLGVFLFKTIVLFLVSAILQVQLRTAIIVGLALSQIGEFSFLLSKIGVDNGLLSPTAYQYFLSVTILSMIMTPFLVFIGPRLADRIIEWPLPQKMKSGVASHLATAPELDEKALKRHLVIIGLGMNGKLLVRTAKKADIPYVILELNAETVREERKKGEPILYGDATQETLLKHVHVQDALVVVIAISDLSATRQIVPIVSKLNPKAWIIARTRFVLEVEHLNKLGAAEVVPVEFEAALRIQKHVLSHFLIPPDEIERFEEKIRMHGFREYISDSMAEYFDPKTLNKIFDDAPRDTEQK